jgi:excinuclease ABC subunit A
VQRRHRVAVEPRALGARALAEEEITKLLQAQGYTRIHHREGTRLEVTQDRVKMSTAEKARVVEAIEAALRVGQGRVNVFREENGEAWRFSTDLHCANCDIHYSDPTPARFSFNSPIGACDTCRGFGRVIGIDYGLIVPDESKTLGDGAVKPSSRRAMTSARRPGEDGREARRALDVAYRDLDESSRRAG